LPSRAKNVAYFAVPILFAVALHWPGLTAWFQKDDFAWLSLQGLIHNWHDFWWALFAPLAQGTIRTLSERIFYLSFTTAFGMHALPFRCWALLTFAGSLTLASLVCAKLTGSRAAGFWAAILWTANTGVAVALSWTAVYYELLCSFVLLLSLWFLLLYVETGERRFYVAQLVTFILGFFVLELNVVYPAIATVYALCCARHILRKILPLFGISALYTAIHMAAVRLPASGPYKMFWDLSMASTLGTYWKWAMGPSKLIFFHIYPSPWRSSLTVFLSLGLAGFLIWKLRQRQWVAAFSPAWFLIVLGPLLPLRNHIDDSYLTIPTIGLAMWGAWALVSGWHAGAVGRIVSVLLLAIYLCASIPVTRVISASFHDRSQQIRTFVLGVADFSHKQPEKLVLLKGVDWEMFWSAVYDRPFRLFGVGEVLVLPEDAPAILKDPRLGDAQPFFASVTSAKDALEHGQAIVLDVSNEQVRDITAGYARHLAGEP
jgi:hypothetical protein